MSIPRVRWTALAVIVIFVIVFVQGSFDFLYAVQSAGFFLAVAAGAVLTALRYIQENLAIGDEVHTMGRDAKRPSLWKRVW